MLEEQFTTIDEASNGEDGVQKALTHEPEIVVMDVGLPDFNGIIATRRIKSALPNTQVVILTAADDDLTILGAIDAGAISVVAKDEAPQVLVEAIERARSGQPYLPPTIARRVMQAALGRFADKSATDSGMQSTALENRRGDPRQLTRREAEILRYVAQGAHNREVARSLAISERTVTNHLMTIYRKLGIRGRAGATAYAIKHDLIKL
jgi:DNA-binding NarL/FixJ family response regulator